MEQFDYKPDNEDENPKSVFHESLKTEPLFNDKEQMLDYIRKCGYISIFPLLVTKDNSFQIHYFPLLDYCFQEFQSPEILLLMPVFLLYYSDINCISLIKSILSIYPLSLSYDVFQQLSINVYFHTNQTGLIKLYLRTYTISKQYLIEVLAVLRNKLILMDINEKAIRKPLKYLMNSFKSKELIDGTEMVNIINFISNSFIIENEQNIEPDLYGIIKKALFLRITEFNSRDYLQKECTFTLYSYRFIQFLISVNMVPADDFHTLYSICIIKNDMTYNAREEACQILINCLNSLSKPQLMELININEFMKTIKFISKIETTLSYGLIENLMFLDSLVFENEELSSNIKIAIEKLEKNKK